jgi:L-lactate dehydrogenase complex protein LldG
MSARDDIFSNIRRSLGVTGKEAPRLAIARDRLAGAPRGVIPARGQLYPAGRVALFRAEAEGVQATTTEVAATEVPAEIARYLRDNNLPATLRMGADPRLADMNWGGTALEISRGASEGDDLNAVSHAFAGVAETGTLVMTSGPDNPVTLNFLPDNHIVVIDAKDIAGDAESVWTRLRETLGKGVMPRAVNMITGPSRSGDIEQKLLLGAHGPRRLHIIVVNGQAGISP